MVFLMKHIMLLFLLVAANSAQAQTNRYNVLFIAVDDLRPELGCYGAEYAQTPNMDKLASTGMLFNKHYVQVATCHSSRQSMLTGRSPGAGKRKPQQGARFMPELFRRSGYHTTCIGKISHSPDGRKFQYSGKGDGEMELPNAWDVLSTPFGPWKRGWGVFFAYADGKHREDGQGHKDLMQFTVEKDSDLPDGMMAETAVETLRQYKKSGERFFLGLGFYKPHLPFVAPKQDWEAFSEVEIPLPAIGKIDSEFWHGSGEFYKYNARHEKTRPLSLKATQQSRRAYLACVRYTDRQVGKVLDALHKLELEQETVVVLWGDHGWHLGEQQIWGKHSPFERANRSVLIIRMPGMKMAGVKTDAVVESLDLFPTLIELCKPTFSKTQNQLDGESLVPLLRTGVGDRDDVAISYWNDAISVRDQTHRLVYNKKTKISKLYDLSINLDNPIDSANEFPKIVNRLEKAIPKSSK
ncbi:sulfatase [bacterium]|nr:sulfatase [bacterium]